MTTVAEGATTNVTLSATDPDSTMLTFALTSAPAFVTRVGATLTIAPGFTDSGMYSVAWTVSDGVNAPVPSSFVLIVSNTNRPPSFDALSDVTMTAGTTRQVSLVATDPDGDAITFLGTSLPAYATLTGSTLTLSPGTSIAESVTVSVTARDALMATAARSFLLTVSPPPNAAPSLSGLRMVNAGGSPLDAGAVLTSSPTLRADLDDPENTSVSLEVEVQLVASPFTNVATHQSTLQPEGAVSVPLPSLAVGAYKWQARAKDAAGLPSAWAPFAGATTAFTVVGGAVSGTLTINAGANATGNTLVTLDYTASSSGGATVTEVCFSNSLVFLVQDCQSTGGSGNRSWTLTGPDGTRTVAMRVRDDAMREFIVTDTIILDTTPPLTGAVQANGTNLYTNDPQLVLTFTHDDGAGTGVTHACALSQNTSGQPVTPSANSPCFQPLSVTGHLFPNGDQLKRVWVWYRDAVGNRSVSPAFDDITLDTTAPLFTSVALASGAAYSQSLTVTFDNVVAADLSGLAQVCVGATNPPTNCGPYSTTPSVTFPGPDGTKTAFIRVIDNAGNMSAVQTDGISVDTADPILTSFTAPPFTNVLAVSGGTVAGSDLGSGLAGTRVTNDGAVVTTFTPFATALGSVPLAGAADGLRTLTARLFDAAGRESNTLTAQVLLDRTAPAAPTVLIEGGAASTPDAVVSVTITPAESVTPTPTTSGIAALCVRHARLGDPVSAPPLANDPCFVPFASPLDVTLPSQGSRIVLVYLRDGAQNVSGAAGSDLILFDTVPPSAPILTSVVAGHRTLTLSWAPSSDGPNGTGVAEYRLWTSTTPGGPYHPLIPLPGTVTSHTLTLANELTHYVVLASVDGVGLEGQAPQTSGTPHYPYQQTFRLPTTGRFNAASRGPGSNTSLFYGGENGNMWRSVLPPVLDFIRVDPLTDGTINGLSSDPSFLIAVGQNAHIAHTTNGTEFRRATYNDPLGRTLNGVAYAGADAANSYRVAVGASGLIVRSVRPAGTGSLIPLSFTSVTSGTTQQLNTVAACGAAACNGVLLVGGNAGTILRSTDWGATWAAVTAPTGYTSSSTHFSRATALPGTTTFLLGVSGSWTGTTSLLISTDSGASFAPLSTSPSLNTAVTALNSESSTVVRVAAGTGSTATLWRLTGTTLTSDPLPTGPSIQTGLFYSFTSGVGLAGNQTAVVGASGNVFYASAGAGTYATIATAVLENLTSVATPRTCGAAYALSSSGLFRSPDTLNPLWTPQTAPFNGMTDAAMPTTTDLFVVGSASGGQGRIFRSTNANVSNPTFTQQTSNTVNGFQSIRCTTSSRCVAVGSNGTANFWNGTSWTPHVFSPVDTTTFTAVALFTEGTLERTIVGGFGGVAYRIDKDTSTMLVTTTPLDFTSATAPSLPLNINIRRVVGTPNVLLAAVESNLVLYGIYRSTNDGTSWTRVITDTISTIEHLGGTTFLAASGDMVYRSTDDGATWTAFPTNQASSIPSLVSCTPASVGSVTRVLGVGAGGLVLHSLNGGRGG